MFYNSINNNTNSIHTIPVGDSSFYTVYNIDDIYIYIHAIIYQSIHTICIYIYIVNKCWSTYTKRLKKTWQHWRAVNVWVKCYPQRYVLWHSKQINTRFYRKSGKPVENVDCIRQKWVVIRGKVFPHLFWSGNLVTIPWKWPYDYFGPDLILLFKLHEIQRYHSTDRKKYDFFPDFPDEIAGSTSNKCTLINPNYPWTSRMKNELQCE